jgi:hypothetical protein
MERWGQTATEADIGIEDYAAYVKVSNRLHNYQKDYAHYFQPAMGLSVKTPAAAVDAILLVARKSKNWQEFDPRWLSNDFTFNAMSTWLRDQGFFKSPHTIEIETLR